MKTTSKLAGALGIAAAVTSCAVLFTSALASPRGPRTDPPKKGAADMPAGADNFYKSDKVTADGVEVTGYPDLARKYHVSSVPKTVVGESQEFVGAVSEETLLQHVKDAAAAPGLLA